MNSLRAKFRHHATPARAKKLAKYTAASVVAVIVTQIVLFYLTDFRGMKGGRAQLIASSIAAVPSYYMNRSWVWAKSGRSHFRKEVLPFWIMVFVGLGFATFVSMLTDLYIHNNGLQDRLLWFGSKSLSLRTLLIQISSVASFGFLWVGKFIIFNKILFAHRPKDQLDPVLDGRSGLPT